MWSTWYNGTLASVHNALRHMRSQSSLETVGLSIPTTWCMSGATTYSLVPLIPFVLAGVAILSSTAANIYAKELSSSSDSLFLWQIETFHLLHHSQGFHQVPTVSPTSNSLLNWVYAQIGHHASWRIPQSHYQCAHLFLCAWAIFQWGYIHKYHWMDLKNLMIPFPSLVED